MNYKKYKIKLIFSGAGDIFTREYNYSIWDRESSEDFGLCFKSLNDGDDYNSLAYELCIGRGSRVLVKTLLGEL
jgi:hypothetical protein